MENIREFINLCRDKERLDVLYNFPQPRQITQRKTTNVLFAELGHNAYEKYKLYLIRIINILRRNNRYDQYNEERLKDIANRKLTEIYNRIFLNYNTYDYSEEKIKEFWYMIELVIKII